MHGHALLKFQRVTGLFSSSSNTTDPSRRSFFTGDGAFGSHDDHGEQVDDGDYQPIDEDTLAFPSHASEFGDEGELIVDYEITDDLVTFDVVLPEECEAGGYAMRGR